MQNFKKMFCLSCIILRIRRKEVKGRSSRWYSSIWSTLFPDPTIFSSPVPKYRELLLSPWRWHGSHFKILRQTFFLCPRHEMAEDHIESYLSVYVLCVCVFQNHFRPITSSCMMVFSNNLAQMINMTRQCVANKNHVARLKVKVTVCTVTVCI